MIALIGLSFGLFAIITPYVFPLFILYPFIFERLEKNQKEFKTNLLILLSLTSFLYLLVCFSPLIDEEYLIPTVSYILYILIFFPLFIIVILVIAICGIASGNFYIHKFRKIAVIIFSFQLFFSSISSTSPIIGITILEKNILDNLLVIVPFAIGLLIPFLLILLIIKLIYKKYRNHKAWIILQVLAIAIYFGLQVKDFLNYL